MDVHPTKNVSIGIDPYPFSGTGTSEKYMKPSAAMFHPNKKGVLQVWGSNCQFWNKWTNQNVAPVICQVHQWYPEKYLEDWRISCAIQGVSWQETWGPYHRTPWKFRIWASKKEDWIRKSCNRELHLDWSNLRWPSKTSSTSTPAWKPGRNTLRRFPEWANGDQRCPHSLTKMPHWWEPIARASRYHPRFRGKHNTMPGSEGNWCPGSGACQLDRAGCVRVNARL